VGWVEPTLLLEMQIPMSAENPLIALESKRLFILGGEEYRRADTVIVSMKRALQSGPVVIEWGTDAAG
jgi:hypothetical protein